MNVTCVCAEFVRARSCVSVGYFALSQNFRLTEMFGSGGRQTKVGMELKSSFLAEIKTSPVRNTCLCNLVIICLKFSMENTE